MSKWIYAVILLGAALVAQGCSGTTTTTGGGTDTGGTDTGGTGTGGTDTGGGDTTGGDGGEDTTAQEARLATIDAVKTQLVQD